ncbi:MAG: ABC transporter substrate-binding protein [Erysipelotrichaceae bacterium]|nr:ABC transporter substrate-binding protein [Erysipelotrichaceae bacterium]
MKKLLIVLLILLMLAGCGTKQEVETETNGEDETVERTDLKILAPFEPYTLENVETIDTAIVLRNIYATLYRLDSNDQLTTELAESYTVNKDFTVYTFTLKDGLLFSDGSPLTSEDVKYSWDRSKEMGNEYFLEIENVETPDEKTVVVTLSYPNNAFLYDVGSEHMSVMSKAAIEAGMDVAFCPNITSGAYYVESWDMDGHHIYLKANENYVMGAPAIKDVCITYVRDAAYHQLLLDGTYDYVTNISSGHGDVPYLKVAENIDLITYDNRSWMFMSLNQNNPYLADNNVRKAIVSAIDVEYIITSVVNGQATPAPLIVAGGIEGYLPGFNESPYDVKAAREYMAQSNYPNGFTMTLEITDGEKVAEAIKTLLKEINIEVEIELVDLDTLYGDVLGGDYDAGFLSYSMYSGHMSHAIPLFDEGYLNIAMSPDTTIGKLMTQSLGVSDAAERDALLSEAYTLMREQWPYVGLYWTTVYDAKVSNLKLKAPVTSERFILSDMYWEQ